jgi:hypothetical protein
MQQKCVRVEKVQGRLGGDERRKSMTGSRSRLLFWRFIGEGRCSHWKKDVSVVVLVLVRIDWEHTLCHHRCRCERT